VNELTRVVRSDGGRRSRAPVRYAAMKHWKPLSVVALMITCVCHADTTATTEPHEHSLIAEYDQFHQPPGEGGDHMEIGPAYGLSYRYLANWIGLELGYSRYDVKNSGRYPEDHEISSWSFNLVFPIEVTSWRRLRVIPNLGIRTASSWRDDHVVYDFPLIDCVGCGDGRTDRATYVAVGLSSELDIMELRERLHISFGGQVDAMYRLGPFSTHTVYPPEMRYAYGIRVLISYSYSITRHN
jgi:hypothetical protein